MKTLSGCAALNQRAHHTCDDVQCESASSSCDFALRSESQGFNTEANNSGVRKTEAVHIPRA